MAEPRYLPYDQVDKTKWDACINRSANGLIYGQSRYLDAMSKHWDALVYLDYEAVMPLTWNRKYAIHYLYQPVFTASLGVFGDHIDAALVKDFLDHVPAKFKYWDIAFNHGNVFSLPDYNLVERMNYVLPLNGSHDTISRNYRDNLKRNIRRSEQSGNRVANDLEIRPAIELAKEQLRHLPGIDEDDFTRFEKLCGMYREMGSCKTYGVFDRRDKLVSSAIFLFSHKRAYYILPGNHPDGKTSGASHALIDAFIKDHTGTDLLLDFEGSDISSLAFFYSSFGAIKEKYSAVRLNRLPGIVKWLKS